MGTLNANSMGLVQNTFYTYRASTVSNWGASATFDMNYYRGKHYVWSPGGVPTYVTIPPATNAISISSLRGHANQVGSSSNCNCDCGNSCGSTCFPAGSLVLMADFTWKKIEDVVVGDLVMSPTGVAVIRQIDRPVLGERRMFRMNDHSLYWSAEHSFWVKRMHREWLWTLDPEALAREAAAGDIGGVKDFTTLFVGEDGKPELFAKWEAYNGGCWEINHPVRAHEFDDRPELPLYLPLTENGELIIVNGYVVGAAINEDAFDYSSLEWENSALYNTKKNV